MKHPPKILVVAGGSGGHILPAVGLCQEMALNKDQPLITFVTNQAKMAESMIDKEFHPIFIKTQRNLLGLLKLLVKAFLMIKKIKPDVVVGFGGYITVPFIFCAKLFGKRAVIHEQNVVLGRANRILGILADKIIISFSETQKFSGKISKKFFLCRYPLRKTLKYIEKKQSLSFFGFNDNFFTVLVVGGSQGAHIINEKFCEAMSSNRDQSRFQIIHICGRRDLGFIKRSYERLNMKYKAFDFMTDIEYAYSAADLVVSRSGAGTVQEIMYFAKPSILVPYQHAHGHQNENAKILAQRGAALILEESKMSPAMINGLLDIFIDDNIRCKTMASIAASIYESNAAKIMGEVIYS